MTTAQRITKRMAETGRTRTKDSIYSVVSDDHTVICHTEVTLDAWWNSLAPEDKGALYELHLEGVLNEPNELQAACLSTVPKATIDGYKSGSLQAVDLFSRAIVNWIFMDTMRQMRAMVNSRPEVPDA